MSALKIGLHPDIAIMAMYPGQFAKSRKGNRILVIKDYYEYCYKDVRQPTTYWECRLVNSKKCPAKAKTVQDGTYGGYLKLRNEHDNLHIHM